MAKKGLSTFLAAELDEEKASYGDIIKLIGAASAKRTLNKNDESIYGDNKSMIEDQSVTGGAIEISVVDDDPSVFGPIIGKTTRKMSVKTGTGEETKSVEYNVGNGNDVAKSYGFGWIEKEKIPGGSIKYHVWFFPKTTWANYDTEAETEAKTASYKKPTIKGTLSKLDNEDYEYDVRVDDLTEAVKVLYAFFGKEVTAEDAASTTITDPSEQ